MCPQCDGNGLIHAYPVSDGALEKPLLLNCPPCMGLGIDLDYEDRLRVLAGVERMCGSAS